MTNNQLQIGNTLLDSVLSEGIPTGKISVIEGKSNLGYSRLTRTIKIYQRTIRILKMLNRKK